MADVMTKIDVTGNGTEVVPMTQAEIDQWDADVLANKTARALSVTQEKSVVGIRNAGIVHALSLGFTQAQAEAMFP